MAQPRGAGRGGGLLFLGVLVFVGYLAATGLEGRVRVVTLVALLAVVAVLTGRVLRRR